MGTITSLALAALTVGGLVLAGPFPPEPPGSPPRPEEATPEHAHEDADEVGRLEDSFPGPNAGFMLRLQSLCGGDAYRGRVTSDDPQDADWRGEALTLGPARCTLTPQRRLARIELPLAVGADRSRTWIVTHHPEGIRLRHRHAHDDGHEDAVSGYGGLSAEGGTFSVQRFPADAESQALFDREGIPASKANVWSLTVVPGDQLAYALDRPNRTFRAVFDLAAPVAGLAEVTRPGAAP